jgi:hypothetical protein
MIAKNHGVIVIEDLNVAAKAKKRPAASASTFQTP